jgi:hypothetical protein
MDLEAPRPSRKAYWMELPGEVIRFLYCGPLSIGSGHFAGTLQNRYGGFPMGKGKLPGNVGFFENCRHYSADWLATGSNPIAASNRNQGVRQFSLIPFLVSATVSSFKFQFREI